MREAADVAAFCRHEVDVLKAGGVDPDEVKLLDKKVGYIKVKQFSGQTTREVQDAMAKLPENASEKPGYDLEEMPYL